MEIEESGNKKTRTNKQQYFDKSISISLPSKKSTQKVKKEQLQELEGVKIFQQLQNIVNQKVDIIVNHKFHKLGEKVLNMIQNKKQEELAYFLNFLFLSVEKNHISQLKIFNEYLFNYLKDTRSDNSITIHRYVGKPIISEILTAISSEIDVLQKMRQSENDEQYSQKSMIFLFDHIYNMDQTQLTLLAKYMDEEYSEDIYSNYQFYFILPSSSNRLVQVQNPSLQYYRLDFCHSQKLINKLLLSIIKDPRIPLFNKNIYKNIFESYEEYSCSYSLNALRVQSTLQELIHNSIDKRDVTTVMKIISEQDINNNCLIEQQQKIPVQVKEIQVKQYLKDREELSLAIQTLQKLLKDVCKNRHVTQKILQYILVDQKDKILFLLPTGDQYEKIPELELLTQIVNNVIQNYFPKYKNLELPKQQQQQLQQSFQRKKKQDRESILLGGATNTPQQKVLELRRLILNHVKDFIFDKISNKFSQILDNFSSLTYQEDDNTSFSQLNNPDMYQNYLKYFEYSTNPLSITFKIIQKCGREIGLDYTYDEYKRIRNQNREEEDEEEELEECDLQNELLNSIQDLIQLGLIGEKQLNSRNVLEKNFYLKANYGFINQNLQE